MNAPLQPTWSRWALLTPLLLGACVPVDVRSISGEAPFPPSTKAIVLAASAPRRPLELYSLAPPFALPLAPTAEQRLLAVAFDHDLDALDLPPGLLTNVPVSGARPWPSPLGVFLSQDGAPFQPYTAPAEFQLPPHDWPAILDRGQCADGPQYLSKSCTATIAVEVAPPQLPRLRERGACPPGWLPTAHSFSRGVTLGMLSVDLCVPPPRQGCSGAELQSAGDAACAAVGPACSPGDPFAAGLSGTAAVIYVLAGAGAGDGSRARPFGNLAQGAAAAVSTGASALAIGRGVYDEALEISGALDVVGACAAETILHGGLQLRRHTGRVLGLSVLAQDTSVLLAAYDSRTEVEGVVLSATSSAAGASTIARSELRLRASVVRLPDRGLWHLLSSRVSLLDSELHAQLYAESATLTVTGSALSSGGGAIGLTIGSTMTVDRSYVATQINAIDSRLDVRRSWFVPSRVEGPNEQRSIYGGRARIHLSQTTFDHRQPVIREPLTAMVETQTAVELWAPLEPSLIEDVVFLLYEPPAEPPRQHFIGLGLFEPPQAPHLVRRTILVGGTFASLGINTSRLRAEDLGIYRVRGTAILGPDAILETARLEVGDCRGSGVDIGGKGRATLSDTGVYDVDQVSLGLKADGPFAVHRARLVSDRGAAGAVHVSDAHARPTDVLLHQLDALGPFETGVHSGFSNRLVLEGFTIDGASRGMLLLGSSEPRRLSFGSVRARGVGLCLARALEDLSPLLNHVGVNAATPVERGE